MQDPIERLLQEHRSIMRTIAGLRTAVQALATRGDAALAETRPALEGTVRMIESELHAHARREDDAMFPVVERAMVERALLEEMRDEHRRIHGGADRFVATLRELHEVEHPAIVAGGERLSGLVATGAGAAALRATAAELIRQLDDHFRKEEEILFPMAREVLEAGELEEVARAMDQADAS